MFFSLVVALWDVETGSGQTGSGVRVVSEGVLCSATGEGYAWTDALAWTPTVFFEDFCGDGGGLGLEESGDGVVLSRVDEFSRLISVVDVFVVHKVFWTQLEVLCTVCTGRDEGRGCPAVL